MVMRLSSTDLKDNTKLLPMNSEDFSLRKCRITTFCTFYFGKKEEKNAYAKNGVPRFLIMIIIIILNDFVRLCGCTIRQIRTAGGKKTTKIDTKSSMASNQKIETHSGIDEHGKVFFCMTGSRRCRCHRRRWC